MANNWCLSCLSKTTPANSIFQRGNSFISPYFVLFWELVTIWCLPLSPLIGRTFASVTPWWFLFSQIQVGVLSSVHLVQVAFSLACSVRLVNPLASSTLSWFNSFSTSGPILRPVWVTNVFMDHFISPLTNIPDSSQIFLTRYKPFTHGIPLACGKAGAIIFI